MKKVFVVLLVGLFVALCITAFAVEPEKPGQGPGVPGAFCGKPPVGPGPMRPPVMGPGPMTGPGLMMGTMPPGFGPGLRLSRSQLEKMWQIEDSLQSDIRPLEHALFFKQSDLDEMYVDPKVDDAAILAKQKEVNALKSRIDGRMVQFRLAQRKIFTAEQLKQLGRSIAVQSYPWPPAPCGMPPFAPGHH